MQKKPKPDKGITVKDLERVMGKKASKIERRGNSLDVTFKLK